jgi:5'(3')-deoxyribonucleotidase
MSFPTDKRLVVASDLDDVLCDFISKFMDIAHEHFDVDPKLRPTSWEWDDVNMTAAMVAGTWDIIHSTPNFWETLDVENGASLQYVSELNRKTRMYFPTARAIVPGRPVEVQSARWLFDNFGLMYPTVVVGNSKGPLAAALKYDYFIDDRPKNCIEVKQASPTTKVFLKNASHNQGVVIPEIPRVKDFDTFAKIVLEA